MINLTAAAHQVHTEPSPRLSSESERPARNDDPILSRLSSSGEFAESPSSPAAVSLFELRELCHAGIHLLDPSFTLASLQYDMVRVSLLLLLPYCLRLLLLDPH